MGAQRLFEPVSVTRGDRRTRGYRVSCRCGAVDTVPFGTIRSRGDDRGQESRMVGRKFEERGWAIGHNPNQDKCPECAHSARRPKLKLVESETMKPVPSTAAVVLQAAPAPSPEPRLTADPPQQMEIDDALLISDKLADVYVGAKEGYTTGWTDARVAGELGVPRAWVARIRIKKFGDGAADNDDIRVALSEATTLLEQCRSVLTQSARIDHEAKALTAEAKSLRGKVDKIERTVIAIDAALRR